MTHPVLSVAGVEKSYGSLSALSGIDLTIDAGVIFGLVGPNGAGKTTLMSIVAGLCRPDRGTVSVNGIDVLAHPQRAREHLGLAPQKLGVYPTVSARLNLVLFGELSGLRRNELRRRIDELEAALGLAGFLNRRVAELSGGQQRRLHVAIALLQRPALILLDEPTAGLDVETRLALLSLVRDLANDGAAVCYSTNVLAEVEELGGNVAIVDAGRRVAYGSVASVVETHARGVVELTFDGPAPDLPFDQHVVRRDSVVRITTSTPEQTLPAVLARLGGDIARLRSTEIVPPNLESVFLALTGRRYEEPDTAAAS